MYELFALDRNSCNYSQYFSKKLDIPKSLLQTLPYFFPSAYYNHFHFQKKFLMKPVTFDFNRSLLLTISSIKSPLAQQMKLSTSNFKLFPTFSYQLPKIYLHFHNKRFFNGTWYIWLLNPPFFLLHLYPLHHLIILLNCFEIEKFRKQFLSEEVQ